MLELKTEHLFDAHFTVENAMVVGDGGWGTRIVGPVTGGTFEGPKIKGTAKNFGADWAVFRHDNVFVVDVRLLLETHDGAIVHMHYDGIVDVTEDQLKRILGGLPTEAAPRVHTAPRFETGHENYLWLNRVAGAAIGELRSTSDLITLDYSVYALR